MPKRLLAVLFLVSAVALAACSDDDGNGDTATDPTSSPVSTATCTYTEDGSDAAKPVDLPPAEPEVFGAVPATMSTTLGDFELTLDADYAPCTVNSFVSLARQGYFDATTCHRLTTMAESGIAVLQCGDPTGSGSGGPGYVFNDELTGQETYSAGVLAMANGGANTNGSQFFIVYRDTPLDGNYTIFGTVDDAAVTAIAKLAKKGTVPTGNGMTGPVEPVDISSVTVD